MHQFMAIIYAIIGTVSLIFALYEADLKWFVFGTTVLFYTKGVRSFLIGRHTKSIASERRLPTAKDWLIIMFGYVVSSVLFLISGLMGEGWLGFLVAPALLLGSFTYWFISRKTENLQKEIST